MKRMKEMNKTKTLILTIIMIAALSIAAAAQVGDKDITVNIKENQTKIHIALIKRNDRE